MITSFIQYLLLAPSYIAVLNVYAVCISFYWLLSDLIIFVIVSRHSSQTSSASFLISAVIWFTLTPLGSVQ